MKQMITVHTDVLGSLLRPPELLAAQKEFAVGIQSQERLKEIENWAVDEAVRLQEAAGLDVVTDGEMRRQSFQSQMTAAVNGFGELDPNAFLWGEWYDEGGMLKVPRPRQLGAVSKLTRHRYLSVDEFVYLKARTSRIPKVTLPSPGLWANFWSSERSSAVYPTLDAFLVDVAGILREEVTELARVGATYIQLDAPHYGLLLDLKTRGFYENQGWTLDRWLTVGAELDNVVMEEIQEVTFGLHI